MTLTAGTRLGPYEIVAPLGAGGMGEVYRARDSRLDRTVAIKILPADLSPSIELKARFEREARAASALNHPHICHLYDIGSQDGTAFLVMEYLEGETLADRLRKGALPLKQALEVGIQITEALATAHRSGILHRDLKPGNVMLTTSGAKLLDFGLAKASPVLAGAASMAGGITPSTPTMTIAEPSSPAKPLTQRGTVVGTFQYMAPEVLQGAEADVRSDIFSLGCVLYEIVTGHRAFEGKSQLSVLTSILEKDPESVSKVQPTSPAVLDHVVKTCLEKNPEERFQTAHDVKLQLKWIAAVGDQAQKPAEKPMSRLAWLVAGVAILALLFQAGYFVFNPHATPIVRSYILPPAGTSFVMTVPGAGPPVISPDGTRLAFTARDDKGTILLYVRQLSSLASTSLPGTEDAMYPFWSPDSREIGFFVPGKLKKINATGGPPQTICDATNGRGGSWSKKGVIVFTPGAAQSIWRVSAQGGEPEPASILDLAHEQNSHRWPWFLPDGKHFLFWARSSRGAQEHSLYMGELGSLDAKFLAKSESMAIYASGHLLFMRDQTLMAQPFDPRGMEIAGEPVPFPIAEHVVINGGTSRPVFSASDTGTLIYQSGEAGGGWNLLWFNRDGKQIGSIPPQDRYFDPALSPDGNRLAITLYGTQGIGDVWIFDLGRGTKTRLTFGAALAQSPVWSADGKTIFFTSNDKGPPHVYAKAADGGGSVQTLLETSGTVEVPKSASPDGKYLVYQRRAVANGTSSSLDLWVLPLFGDRKPFPIVQTAFDDTLPAISPDGRWMAYQNSESGRNEIYITAFPGGGAKWQISSNGGVEARWRKDGKELFFLNLTDDIMAVDVNTAGNVVQLGVPHVLFHAVGVQRQASAYEVTADGKKFLLNSGNLKEDSEPLTLVQNWPEEIRR
jgi:serine/threonine protein kinase/sugar lactone lactonase YvrE